MSNSPPGADFRPGTYMCPTCNEPYFRDYAWKATCVPCYLSAKKKREAPEPSIRHIMVPVPTPIEPDMLRRLLFLVHPDKHNGSEAAAIATRYLLGLRGQAHGR